MLHSFIFVLVRLTIKGISVFLAVSKATLGSGNSKLTEYSYCNPLPYFTNSFLPGANMSVVAHSRRDPFPWIYCFSLLLTFFHNIAVKF